MIESGIFRFFVSSLNYSMVWARARGSFSLIRPLIIIVDFLKFHAEVEWLGDAGIQQKSDGGASRSATCLTRDSVHKLSLSTRYIILRFINCFVMTPSLPPKNKFREWFILIFSTKTSGEMLSAKFEVAHPLPVIYGLRRKLFSLSLATSLSC